MHKSLKRRTSTDWILDRSSEPCETMSLTPRVSIPSGCKRTFSAVDIAQSFTMEPYKNQAIYRPRQSICDGEHQHFSDDSGEEQENYPPLASSSQRNALQGQGPHSRSIKPTKVDVIATIQHEILDTQKRMQSKQEDFDRKLQELAKSSSSSPDTSRRKKVKISRDLTVSISSDIKVLELIVCPNAPINCICPAPRQRWGKPGD